MKQTAETIEAAYLACVASGCPEYICDQVRGSDLVKIEINSRPAEYIRIYADGMTFDEVHGL